MDDAEQTGAVLRLRDALSVMELAVSSRFTEYLTRHGYEAAPADRTSVGATDFRQRRTRMRHWVVGEAMEDIYRQSQAEGGPIVRLVMRGWRRFGKLHDDRDDYCERGGHWSYDPRSEQWSGRPGRPDSAPGRARSSMDPVHHLDFLPAITQVTGTGHDQTDYGEELTRFDAIADLRDAELDKMTVSYLKGRLSRFPISVWLDTDGLVRRMRYKTTPPGAEAPMHRRIDFYDFGAPVERPEIPESE